MDDKPQLIVPKAKTGQPINESWTGPGRELSRKVAVFQQIRQAGRRIFVQSGAVTRSPETKGKDTRYPSTFLGMGYLMAMLSQVPSGT
jgi:hypothetical protein